MSEMQTNIKPINPQMDPQKDYQEINSYVVFWGLFFAAVFTLAVSYLCLKIGQTVDAFAPVSILAMGMAVVLKRKNAFPETVHIQAIASSGTNTLCGAMFILPAIYILNISDVSFVQMAIPCILGALLGVLLSAMFRRYFCEEMHYVYPFPSGRAAAEVLSSSEGGKAKLMILSGIVGLLYDFILNTLGWWKEVISTTAFDWGQVLQTKFKLGMSLDSDAALLGIGYFTGLRYAAVIGAGSFFAWFVCIPVVYYLGGDYHMVVNGKEMLLADAPTKAVFSNYVRCLGIGALAMSGVIGLLSMSNVVATVLKKAVTDIFDSSKTVQVNLLRTQRDLPMSVIGVGAILLNLLFTIYFHFEFAQNITQTIICFFLVLVLSFLLSVVGISSIAFTANEPVSGITIFMILIAGVIFGATGMSGDLGIVAILMMAAFMCTCIALAGNFMGELKVAHLVGATPAKMQQWQLVGVILSAIVSIGVLILLNSAYGFVGEGALNAPQANAMAAITAPLMSGGSAPWPLYMAGAFLAVVVWMIRVPPLAFALGAYLPMEINTPVIIGGLLSYLLSHSSKDEILNELRVNEGSTIASGLVAGGAIGSLFSAVLHIANIDIFMSAWNDTAGATFLGIAAYVALCLFLYKMAMRAKH